MKKLYFWINNYAYDMTPKQEERIKDKIKKIKAELAADKKRWGGFYDDSRGLRYLPPQQYIKLQDYKGGLRYFNWFAKNFSDDAGFPDFLFEWAIVLFKTGKLKEAEIKAFETYCSNTFILNIFLGSVTGNLETWEDSGVESEEFALKYFSYSSSQNELSDFTDWLTEFVRSDKFQSKSKEFIHIQKQLSSESELSVRQKLMIQKNKLLEDF